MNAARSSEITSNLHRAIFKKTEIFVRMIQSRVRWVRHAAYKQDRLLLAGQGAMGFTKRSIS
jgi:hypothetical protein